MKRVIVVTGASKGIGRATADFLATGAWRVIGVARHAPADFPGEFLPVDLSDPAAAAELAGRLYHATGRRLRDLPITMEKLSGEASFHQTK